MTEDRDLSIALDSEGISIAGKIVRGHGEVSGYIVFVNVSRTQDNKQVPSNKKLDAVRDSLRERNIYVDFILTDERQADIEGGARATLIRHFGDLVRNAFLSASGSVANMWLDLKRDATELEIRTIRAKVELYLDLFGMRLDEIYSTKNVNVPSKLACIRALRKIAPADSSALSLALIERGFVVPSPDFLARRLDGLRRSGLVLRLRTGRYVLTAAGLASLGTIKNRRSPDIEHLLDLAWRGG